MSEVLAGISDAIIAGDIGAMVDLTEDALDDGFSPQDILDKGLMPGMDYVGVEFKAGRMFVPEVLRSARAMQSSMDIIKPMLAEGGVSMAGIIVLGTVKGDLHDIGKNLVGMMCEGAGFEVYDIGKDIGPDGFVAAVKEYSPTILGMSALLTTTMRSMQTTIDALKEAGVRDQVKIMIGGAPVTKEFADSIGADGYASNAASAVELAKRFAGRA